MEKYNAIYMNPFFNMEEGLDYWFLYDSADNLEEGADLLLFSGEMNQIELHNVDLGSCDFILYKAGEFKIEGCMPVSMDMLGQFHVEPEIALKENGIDFVRREGIADINYHIITGPNGFCAVKMFDLDEDDRCPIALKTCFNVAETTLCERNLEQIEVSLHGEDLTEYFVNLLKDDEVYETKEALQLLRILTDKCLFAQVKFLEGTVTFNNGFFSDHTMTIRENGEEAVTYSASERQMEFMNWIL